MQELLTGYREFKQKIIVEVWHKIRKVAIKINEPATYFDWKQVVQVISFLWLYFKRIRKGGLG